MPEIKVIYKTSDFLVINKPAGVLVHRPVGSKFLNSSNNTVVSWLLDNYPEVRNVGEKFRPGIVHRLDRDTSGAMIIALNQKSFDYFKNLFKQEEVKKTYLALIFGIVPKSGKIDKPIGLSRKGVVKRTTYLKKAKLVKSAVTLYQRIKSFKFKGQEFSLVKVIPLTGRTHQIRIHFSSIHHPIVGDSMYGRKSNPFGLKRPFLHSLSLEFNSFLQREGRVRIEAGLPADLEDVLNALQFKMNG